MVVKSLWGRSISPSGNGLTSDRHRTNIGRGGVCDARWLEGMKKVPIVFGGNGWAPLSFDIEYWSDGCVHLLAGLMGDYFPAPSAVMTTGRMS